MICPCVGMVLEKGASFFASIKGESQNMKNNSGNAGRQSSSLSMVLDKENKEEEGGSSNRVSKEVEAREEEIVKKKMEVREKVQSKLGRAEEESKRLAQIWKEVEAVDDPMGKEVANVRKKIDILNREVKSAGHNCQKKEKEYKEALEAFDEKKMEKTQLTTKLLELVSESERVRMQKLEELSRHVR